MFAAVAFVAGVAVGAAGVYTSQSSEHSEKTMSLSMMGKIAYHLRFLFSAPVRAGLKIWYKVAKA